MQNIFKHAKIKGISVVLPKKEINIYDEGEYYNHNQKKIDRMHDIVGFYKRRVADADITASDLSIQAAENLIKGMKIDVNSIDSLIFVVQQPDYKAPSTAYYIHQKLGLPQSCTATDINQGCVGWLYGLWLASTMIESGNIKRILLLAGDTPSKNISQKDRQQAPIFGDGGTATLIEYVDDAEQSFFEINTYSKGFEAIIVPAGGERLPLRYVDAEDDKLNSQILALQDTQKGYKANLTYPYLNGLQVFDFTINEVPKDIRSVMKYAHITHEDICACVLHQANKQIVLAVGEAAGFENNKIPYHAFEHYGNNTMCSIPCNLVSVLEEKITKEKNKFLCCAFGNGLVSVAAVIDFDHIWSSGIVDYVVPKDKISTEELLHLWQQKISENE